MGRRDESMDKEVYREGDAEVTRNICSRAMEE